MIVTAHQPHFMPWIGYINRIHLANKFVLMDNLQYEQNNYINRNRILGANGIIMLTVPVSRQNILTKTIREIEIPAEQYSLFKKHLKAFKNSYSTCDGFETVYPLLEKIYAKNYKWLFDLDLDIIQTLCTYLSIDTEIIIASERNITGHKEGELIISILEQTNSKSILLGLGASTKYINASYIQSAGFDLCYQTYTHPEYKQKSKTFISGISSIDLLMNSSQEQATHLIKNAGRINE